MALAAGTDNIITALEQSNRVCQVILWGLTNRKLEQVLAAMQVPFPELTDVQLASKGGTPPVIPDSFLGGSAPRLLRFSLIDIPFPGLPKLLSSATHLVRLLLKDIPHSGYISSEAMIAAFAVLSSLETLCLQFKTPESHPDWETPRQTPPKCSFLPALEYFSFKGSAEYLEDLVTFIDAPQLDSLKVSLFNEIDSTFDLPRLAEFINRTPKHKKCNNAHLQFNDWNASVTIGILEILIPLANNVPDQRLSYTVQICNSSLHRHSTVEDLYFNIDPGNTQLLYWKKDAIENTLWLQLLLPFTAVKNLYIYEEFAPSIAATLQELVGDRVTEVLPSLQSIFVMEDAYFVEEGIFVGALGSFQRKVGQFVVARQLSGYPVTISEWYKTE
jgi:hypothetical protein